MYGVNTIEEKKQYIMSIADNKRTAAAMIRRVRNTVRSFDGKIYNCKFDEAISALTDEESRFYCSNSYGWFYIYYTPRKSSLSRMDEALLSGYSCKSSDYVKLQTNENAIMFDGKRVIADKMEEALKAKRESLLKEAYELETVANELEETMTRIKSTKALLNNMVQALPQAVRDACNLKYCY